jgi:hypothetical protein
VVRFLPFRFVAEGIHQAGFGGGGFGAAVTTGTALILGGPFGGRRVGLPLEGLLEHAFGEYFPNGDDEVFDFREFGAPSRTVGTPDLFDEIFGDAVKVGSNFIDGGR